MRVQIPRLLCLFLLLGFTPRWAAAQEFDFRAPPSAGDPAVPAAMRDLATRVLPVYQEKDSERYLNNLSALQLVSGDPASAYASRQSLRERRRSKDAGRPVTRAVLYDMYIRARASSPSCWYGMTGSVLLNLPRVYATTPI